MKLDPSFLDFAVCPQCHEPLRESVAESGAQELVCTAAEGCGLAYPVRDDIPVLLIDEARHPG